MSEIKIVTRDTSMVKANVTTIYVVKPEGGEPNVINISGSAIDLLSMSGATIGSVLMECPGLMRSTRKAMRRVFWDVRLKSIRKKIHPTGMFRMIRDCFLVCGVFFAGGTIVSQLLQLLGV